MGFINTVITLILLAALCVAENSPEEAAKSIAIKSPEEALQRALDYTGFGATKNIPLSKAASLAKQIVYHDDRTPFLNELYDDKPVWCVSIDSVSVRLSGTIQEVIDENPKNFEVYIEPDSGKLLRIISPYYGDDPNILPPLLASEAAQQLWEVKGEKYTSYLEIPPTATFLDALEGSLICPLLAKEILAICVMRSCGDSEPLPTWVICLRGSPPRSSFSHHGSNAPVYFLNYSRTIIDAETGAHLNTSNFPVPTVPRDMERR